jgi:hypothetical protein
MEMRVVIASWIFAMGSAVGLVGAELPNPVLAWNDLMMAAVRADTTGPTVSTRNLAILHAAMFDSINSVDRSHQPYRIQVEVPAGTSMEAAAIRAGREVMRVLYPSYGAAIDSLYEILLGGLPVSSETTDGLLLGETIALQMLAARSTDGASTFVPYIPSMEAGEWLRTPPYYRPPLDPHWRYVTLFCLEAKEPYVAPGPPGLTSEEYARDFLEVKTLGGVDSTLRTMEQGEIARFWSDFSYTAMPPGHWHEIAASIAAERGEGLVGCSRLMTLLSLAQADAAIVCWEGKYRHNFWRPITAIQRADEDGNPATEPAAEWDHFLVAPNFPEYPSGHSTFSKAGAQMLARFYGTDAVTFTAMSDELPGVTRRFTSLAACADEVGRSRIYGGIHFEFANRDGKASGRKVADAVFDNYLLPSSGLPVLRLEGDSASGVRLRIHGLIGDEYEVEATSDFTTWHRLTTVVAVSGGVVWQDPEGVGARHRFYRVLSVHRGLR